LLAAEGVFWHPITSVRTPLLTNTIYGIGVQLVVQR